MRIALTNAVLYLTTCVVDTGAKPTLINKYYLKTPCKFGSKYIESPNLGTKTNEVTINQGVIQLS